MMTAILILAALWLAIGSWLSIGGLRKAMPHIRAEGDPLPIRLFGIAFAFVAGAVYLPAPFLRAVVRGAR